jgi:glycosyltransferase involved in cell wall biosynthesis
MRGHVKPLTRERLEYIWSFVRQGPTEVGYAYFRARRRKKNRPDEDTWLNEWDRLPLEAPGRFDISDAELAANARALEHYERAESVDIRSIQWFVPWVPTVFLGGVYTILRFAAHFRREHGVESRFCIYDVPEDRARRMTADLRAAFPELAGAEVTFRDPPTGGPSYSHLRDCDAAIATFWPSAYPVLRFERAAAKFFFVQDFEPYFYPASSAFALAEETYRFGFPGIVNTPGLAAAYRAYGNPTVSFTPAVELDRYRPPDHARPDSPVRVFFYGRPSNARNAFGLGLASLAELKERYGPRVDVVCAGESWNPGQFGYADKVSNVGRLRNLQEVSDLYRSCHIGLVLMFTKHPSYQPFEFMASGMACVSNVNPDTAWFLEDQRNCLLSRPVPDAIAGRIGALVDDRELRDRITSTALEQVRSLRWENQIERVWRTITKLEDGFERPPAPRLAATSPTDAG